MMPIANTKNVNTNGRRSVSQGQWVTTAKTVSATNTKNKIRYSPLFLLCISMWKNFGKNRRGGEITKDIFFTLCKPSLSTKAFLIFAEV